ncbi:hypothetical protein BHE74_00034481 [Ensete ventricosum]|uniref:Uncharacterized protein n=1 Tax=Ensete ventricosum TaxID=4639 RepID=A0A444FQM6_ENSVE|nr:hypothetical protein B296_00036153 [Ensete ventricosum]RWW24944.1 hypothetical protein GW17_00010737 [Ensete ventricosum]RWW58633.1 hypothetical protein BHE74_00034481 [Ensete ventricosum]RZR82582.1 hypothetical protein BHM03_00009033 [Ensete ventricosum]
MFTLVHIKIRNKLSYKRIEKLIYVHYNMHVRMQSAELHNEPKQRLIPSTSIL